MSCSGSTGSHEASSSSLEGSPADDLVSHLEKAVCLSDGSGFFKATLAGDLNHQFDLANDDVICSGVNIPGSTGFSVGISAQLHGEDVIFSFTLEEISQGESRTDIQGRLTINTSGKAPGFWSNELGDCLFEVTSGETLTTTTFGNIVKATIEGNCSSLAPRASAFPGSHSPLVVSDIAMSVPVVWQP
jgi:hypothetical protein